MIVIETKRLLLRPWNEADAQACFRLASDPAVGPPAGWEPHPSTDYSLEIIRTVFSAPETYAVVMKSTGALAGCCGIVPPGLRPDNAKTDGDAEIGYWLGKDYWGHGLMPEAVEALMRHARGTLGCRRLWIAFSDGNIRSRRVAEKCGFEFHHSVTHSDGTAEHYYLNTSSE